MVFLRNPVARWFDDYRHILSEFESKKIWLFYIGDYIKKVRRQSKLRLQEMCYV
jgi:hypothetical protein